MAIVITAVVFGLFKVKAMKYLYRLSRVEFWLAMAALLGVLTFGTLAGVFIGVTLSLLWLIWRTSHPPIQVLGRMPEATSFHSVEQHSEATTIPGIVILRFDGPLYFATASSLRERVRKVTRDAEPPVQAGILDLESTSLFDLKGSDELRERAKELKELGATIYLARVKNSVREILVNDGVSEVIPEEHFYLSVKSAVAAAAQSIDTAV